MDVPPPERILLVRLSHLGDVVHGLPVLHALRRAWPDAELGWALQPEYAGLLVGVPGLARIFHFERRGGPGAWLRLRRALRAWGPDWSVDSQGNAKSALVAWCSGARERFGYARQDWREPAFARLARHAAPPAYGPHALHRVLALLERVAPGQELDFDLGLGAQELARGRSELDAHLPAGGGPAWLLHLGSPGDPRSWPAGHWADLATRLADAGGRVLFLSGPGAERVGTDLGARLSTRDDIGHWIGQRGLRALAATMAAAARQGARYVGGDSGPSHLAAAVGLPVTMLSGPQDPALTGPWPLASSPGSPHQVLRAVRDGPGPIEGLDAERVAAALLSADCA